MENKKLKYEIPRNVKAGGMFLNLNVKGWVCFLTVSSFFGITSLLLFGASFTTFVVTSFAALIAYFSLEIDEKTGYSNIQNASILFQKALMNKTLTPQWGGNENEKKQKSVFVNIKAKKQ
jgi:hypothetical protein